MRINNNIMAMNTHRQYGINNTNVSSSVEKLSSGYRINRAGDDAAGLAISEKMRAQIRGLTMASKNSQDAISLVQTAEGALQTTHDILQRMREIAVQSSSDSNESTIDRGALNKEFQALMAEIDDTASKTAFNDQKLIDGTFAGDKNVASGVTKTGLTFDSSKLTATADFDVAVTITAGAGGTPETGGTQPTAIASLGAIANTSAQGITGIGITFSGIKVGSEASFNTQNITDLAINTGTDGTDSTISIKIGTTTFSASAADLTATDATIELSDTDGNKVTLNFTGALVFANAAGLQADLGTLNTALSGGSAQAVAGGLNGTAAGPNTTAGTLTIGGKTVADGATSVTLDNGLTVNFDSAVDLKALTNTSYGAAGGADTWNFTVTSTPGNPFVVQTGANSGDELKINIDNMDATSLGLRAAGVGGATGVGIDISSQLSASAAITKVNDAINQVSSQRADLGALQNRLEFKISNLDTSAENLQSAESRIRDLDMAKEMTEFTKNNILSQAATAMLAQANSLPQGVLQLLG